MKVEGHLVGLGRYRPAPDTEMDGQTAGRQIGDRGLGRRLRRQRIVAALDAVDDLCRLTSPVFDRDGGIGSEGDSLQAGRAPGLDHIDLAPCSMDPDSEAGEVPVPEDGILVGDRQPVDAAPGQFDRASPRHGLPSFQNPSSNRTHAASYRWQY